jgi:hypothetical protein
MGANPTHVVKYFFEEPASLEALSPNEDPDARGRSIERSLEDFLSQPRHYRGYLTATDLSTERFGLTLLPGGPFETLLGQMVGARHAHMWFEGGELPLDPSAMRSRERELLAVIIGERVDRESIELISGTDRRRMLPFLRSMLESTHIVMLPEPAHHGIDLSLFSSEPLKSGVEAALKRIVRPDIRAFSIPHREARSEEKFYFERYDLERYRVHELMNE